MAPVYFILRNTYLVRAYKSNLKLVYSLTKCNNNSARISLLFENTAIYISTRRVKPDFTLVLTGSHIINACACLRRYAYLYASINQIENQCILLQIGCDNSVRTCLVLLSESIAICLLARRVKLFK